MPLPDFDSPSTDVPSPAMLAHVVLRTKNLRKLEEYYVKFLGGHIVFNAESLSFITYDGEHHRIALVGIPTLADKNPQTCGLEHIAFAFPTITDLLLAYRRRKNAGIMPTWCVNHGPTTSIYYTDPDGNMLETQADNYATVEEANAFFTTPEFLENPIGADFDPEDHIAKLKSGADENSLKKRANVGPRGVEDVIVI